MTVISTSHPAAHSRTLLLGLIAEPPADGPDCFRAATTIIKYKTDQPDHQNCGDDEVIPLAGVARIDHKKAESGINRDHLRGNHHQPGNAQRDAQSDKNLWKSSRENHFCQKLRRGQAKVAPGAPEYRRHVGNAVDAGYDDRKKCAKKD